MLPLSPHIMPLFLTKGELEIIGQQNTFHKSEDILRSPETLPMLECRAHRQGKVFTPCSTSVDPPHCLSFIFSNPCVFNGAARDSSVRDSTVLIKSQNLVPEFKVIIIFSMCCRELNLRDVWALILIAIPAWPIPSRVLISIAEAPSGIRVSKHGKDAGLIIVVSFSMRLQSKSDATC